MKRANTATTTYVESASENIIYKLKHLDSLLAVFSRHIHNYYFRQCTVASFMCAL